MRKTLIILAGLLVVWYYTKVTSSSNILASESTASASETRSLSNENSIDTHTSSASESAAGEERTAADVPAGKNMVSSSKSRTLLQEKRTAARVSSPSETTAKVERPAANALAGENIASSSDAAASSHENNTDTRTISPSETAAKAERLAANAPAGESTASSSAAAPSQENNNDTRTISAAESTAGTVPAAAYVLAGGTTASATAASALLIENSADTRTISADESTADTDTSEGSILASLAEGSSAAAGYISSYIPSKRYPDKGLYGSLNFLFIDDEYRTGSYVNSQQDFVQEYKLGYMGNIYSPRLLDYTVEGLFRHENLKTDSGSIRGETKVNSQDYKVNLAFIKETDFPFTLYALKTNRPVSTIYSVSSTRYEQNLENYGIDGSMRFDLFTVGYGASKEKSIHDNIYTLQERESDQYHASIGRSEKSYSYKLSYRHLERLVNNVSADYNMTTFEIDDTVDFSYRLKMSDDWTLNSGLLYVESDYYNSKTTNANVNLLWMPKTDYSGSVSMTATRADYFIDNNASSSADTVFADRVDTLNVAQVLSYRPTMELTLTENIGFNTYKSNAIKGDNAYARLGANYNKQLSKDTVVRLSTSGDVRTNRNENRYTIVDSNASTKQESFAVNIQAGVNQKYPSLRSTLDVSGNYYAMRTTRDEARDRYGAHLSFSSTLSSEFRNMIDVSYSREESSVLFTTTGDLLSRAVVRTDVSEYLDYATRLGDKGRLTAKAGVRYSDIENDGFHISRVVPRADLKLNYRFWQRVVFTAGAEVDKDFRYNYLNYSAMTNLSYKIRKTSFSMGYQYYKTEVTEESGFPERERSRFDMRLTRTF